MCKKNTLKMNETPELTAPRALIALEDGTVFYGESFGAKGVFTGELVFQTAATGYQEILTDPSYFGQGILFTNPHIGNVGINKTDYESEAVHCEGIVVRSFSSHYSNWRADAGLESLLIQQNKFGITGIDTRALTHIIRDKGSLSFCVMTLNPNEKVAKDRAKNIGLDKKKYLELKEKDRCYLSAEVQDPEFHIVLLDFGVKKSILKSFMDLNCKISVLTGSTTTIEEILALAPDAVVLSNGPGDPRSQLNAIAITKVLIKKGLPLFGICLGHQILGIACGAEIVKMKYGHHGANHPVLDLETNRVAVSSQNHCYVVDEQTFPKSLLKVSHRSLFDHTIAGFKGVDTPIMGFQGHPEAGPGPNDLRYIFTNFIQMLREAYAQTNRH
jgi:carbamoyl-phosphate synthase small subunit